MKKFFKMVKIIFTLAVIGVIAVWLYMEFGSTVKEAIDEEKAERAESTVEAVTGEKPFPVKTGRYYILNATDGSGTVPLFRIGDTDGTTPAAKAPDGIELRAKGVGGYTLVNGRYDRSVRDGILVEYEGISYSVKRENLTPSERKGYNTNTMLSIVFFGVLILMFFYYKIIYRKRAHAIFKRYYDRKRKKIPWLDNWMKQGSNSKIPKTRADNAVASAKIISIGWTIGSVVFSASIGLFFFTYNTAIIILFAGMLFGVLLAERKIRKPGVMKLGMGDKNYVWTGKEFTLECPSCHCPHSWGKYHQNFDVEKVNIEKEYSKKRTTTTSGVDSSDFLGNVLGGTTASEMMLGQKTRRKVKEQKNKFVYYTGKEIVDYKCENCNHEIHKDDSTSSYNYVGFIKEAEERFYFTSASFRNGGPLESYDDRPGAQKDLASWADGFMPKVRANASAANIPDSVITSLQNAVDQYKDDLKNLKYLDIETSAAYLKSNFRLFAHNYLFNLSNEQRALFDMPPRKTVYIWDEKK